MKNQEDGGIGKELLKTLKKVLFEAAVSGCAEHVKDKVKKGLKKLDERRAKKEGEEVKPDSEVKPEAEGEAVAEKPVEETPAEAEAN